MEALPFFVGVIGNIISVLFFLSPVKTFWIVLKKRSTEEFDSLPYISTFLTAALWAYYGLIKPDGFLIVSVNIFGISLQICYLTIFLLFSPPNMRVRTATLVAIFNVGFVGATILISYLMLHGSSRIEVIGFICAALNIMNCGSPLGIARKVVRTRSVEYMPFLLTLCIFLNSGVWTFYAVLVKDPYIGVPNLIGFLLGVMQLVIYVIYMNESKSSKEDHSSIHDQLLPPHSDMNESKSSKEDHSSIHDQLLPPHSDTTRDLLS
ncbi:bidirectional sugar transporter SWEET17-like [Cucurbita maxima]|uniref:Bidirectional sugar transporter SWEET n=1 Tax=Cucurbita maxima TaxID=3661 RepID=A0A6J1HQX2_CUCMA|nr:bidirectional sugar transporter SWEET17-like [Cucurbita maxima]